MYFYIAMLKEHQRIITEQISKRESLMSRTNIAGSTKEIDLIMSDYSEWDKDNKLILEKGFKQLFQQFYRMYSTTNYLGNINVDKDSFEFKSEKLLNCLQKK
ncbi:MAG: hypothetical protein A3F72_08830 [Bacteroidetes bacterium RIFCSPLOWO2_12_FULL_35_15]|nr:MAG: hypothetical protein A3F72_08830 [Bacteroidetes bacterium RIFCSPLOWO2_12_FULL_35_15]